MDLFNLQATLGLNASSFIAGIGNAQQLFANFAGAVVGFAGDVMRTGMGFDESMAAVKSVLGDQEGTVENMNRLRAFALDQARTSKFTSEEAADAYYYMGMAGWKSEQMLAGLPAVMQLAAASGENLGRTSDIVTDSLTAFGLKADDAQHYSDILAQAATNSNTNVGLMGETFKYVAPLAGTLGADVEDVAVCIGLMANAGTKGSMAGTALRNIFQRLSANAPVAALGIGALDIITEKLGVSFWDSTGKMRDWGDVIAETRVKWADLTQQQQIAYAKGIATERGMAGWLNIMNAGVDDVEKLTKAINEADGAAQKMSATRLDSLAGDVDLFHSSLDVLKIAIYDETNGPMREVVQWATGALDDITDAVNENGLAGGIEVLSQKIDELAEDENIQKLLESIGGLLGTVFDGALEKLLPKVEQAAPRLVSAFFGGLGGAAESSSGELTQLVGVASNALSGVFNTNNGIMGVFQNLFKIKPVADIDDIQAALDEADEKGEAYITINDVRFPASLDAVTIMDSLIAATDSCVTDGIAAGAVNGEKIMGDSAETIGEALSSAIGGAGTDGGATAGVNMEGVLAQSSDTAAGYLSNAIGGAGTDAGTAFGNSFQASLNNRTYSINVNANVSGMPAQQNASAMSAGRIYSNATLFGYANGAFQVAGDAGPEAVVGVGSLQHMIAGAVMSAMSAMGPSDVRDSRPINIVFELEGAQKWIYRLNKAEEQRVGLKLSKGGND